MQMWAAAVEVLDRGVNILANDNKGNTALDVLVECAKELETVNVAKHELYSPGSKVDFVKQSRLYADTPAKRRVLLDRFLSFC